MWDASCVSKKEIFSASNSWKKPELFYQRVKDLGVPLIKPIELTEYRATELLTKVHSESYVESVLQGLKPTGFGVKSAEVARAASVTCHMMVEAAVIAVTKKVSICVPVSGFHHAGYNFAGGFCTFNGLMAAAVPLVSKGKRVFILDCDAHSGNGTEDIYLALDEKYEFTNKLIHWSYGYSSVAKPKKGEQFLKELGTVLSDALKKGKIDVLLYQAGADPHINDPLGGFLTSEEMQQRDSLVFEFAKKHRIPVVWNLAGGYQDPYGKVLDLHVTTFTEWLKN